MRQSFSGRIWRPRVETGEHHRQLAKEVGLRELFAGILAYRALETPDQVEAFLQPRLSQLPDPLELMDMDKAVARLIRVVEEREPFVIYGDYDVDGVTSCALLYRYFKALGHPPRIYVPDRLSEGYGPNPQAMRTLAAEGARLVITVDCGIMAHEALEVARESGLDVIVTDHHQGRESLPPAIAVINPNRLDETFPHKELAGVGVAFYLLLATNRALRQRGLFQEGNPAPDLKSLLDLVAVGTIADVASLTDLNRPLTSAGLRMEGTHLKPGLRALMEVARLSGERMSAGQIGFQIGPRINAGGRLGKGTLGAELLITDDPQRAMEIARILDDYNQERQILEKKIFQEAVGLIEGSGSVEGRHGVVVGHEGWHPGVVGIVASRLAERYHRPTVVLALDAEGGGKGSARSIPGLDLYSAVAACEGHLAAFGGHRAAAGLTLRPGQLAPFTLAFDQAVREQNPTETFQPALLVDGELDIVLANLELAGRIERLQPFGRGNPEPLWIIRNVRLLDARVVKDRHLKCMLADPWEEVLDAIAFGVLPGEPGSGMLNATGRLDVAGTLSINRFRNRESVQLLIKDARPAV
ncbi:MAG: single-stranded-DNA-specific exonuclease RecJ [Magnetococcales bacterium]|nr:single-stranded-DNA-specific exonuclease RecJ [Magnetococcales bacterium]